MTEQTMQQTSELMRRMFEASAPEPEGDEERTRCEWCGKAFPNATMVVIGDHWVCADCDQDGDCCHALALALQYEEDALLRAVDAAFALVQAAKRYRHALRPNPGAACEPAQGEM
jgi:hypothetical protein